MGKSQKRKREEKEEEEEEEVYYIEVILKARVVVVDDDGAVGWEYFVKWAGYRDEDNSWEPGSNLAGCQRLLKSFWTHIGTDDNDYAPGYIVEPSKDWIKKEKKYFKREFTEDKEKARIEKEKEEKRKEEKYGAKVKKRKKASSPALGSASRPSASTSNASGKERGKGKGKEKQTTSPPVLQVSQYDSEDSEDDVPLSTRKRKRTDNDEVTGLKFKLKTSSKGKEKEKVPQPILFPLPTPNDEVLNSLLSPPSSAEISLSEAMAQAKHSHYVPAPPVAVFKPKAMPGGQAVPTGDIASFVGTSSKTSFNRNTSTTASTSSSIVPPKPPLPSKSASTTPTIPQKTPTITIPPKVPAAMSGKTPTQTMSPKVPSPTILYKTPSLAGPPPPSATRLPSRGIKLTNVATSGASSGASSSAIVGSALSTKQRLTAGALALAPTSSGANFRSASGSGLGSLSFKKKTATSIAEPPTPMNTLNAGTSGTGKGTGAGIRPPSFAQKPPPANSPVSEAENRSHFEDLPMVRSPTEMLPDDDLFGDGPDKPPPAPPPKTPLLIEAEAFLEEMMPSALAAPLRPAIETIIDPRPLKPLPRVAVSTRIPKKWKWIGKILMDVNGKDEELCSAIFTDSTEPPADGIRFNGVMGSKDFVRLLSFHDLVDMPKFLMGCKMSPQFARIIPSEKKDEDPLKTMARYMTKKQHVSLIPVYLDGALVGHILVFPPFMTNLVRHFNLPKDLLPGSTLIAALLTTMRTPSEVALEHRKSFPTILPAHIKSEQLISTKASWDRTLRLNSLYHYALQILRFPKELHQFMRDRKYGIWYEGADGLRNSPGFETRCLSEILKQCGGVAQHVSQTVRVVFLHVGSLKAISKLPGLADRRTKYPEVSFYTYGTHETVPSHLWGVREIYPIGGVATFTPSALCKNPWACIQRIREIEKHPLWTAYLLPSVVGMAARIACGVEDPLAVFDRDKFPLEFLLEAIDKGNIALTRSPPLEGTIVNMTEARLDWIRENWIRRPPNPRKILEFCVRAFNSKYANIQETEWESTIFREISSDLSSMQLQPVIMEEYRRFVIITSDRDSHVKQDGDAKSSFMDGFERVSVKNFDFKEGVKADTSSG